MRQEPFAQWRDKLIYLINEGQIINGGNFCSVSSIFAGAIGAAPAAVYVESAAVLQLVVNRAHCNCGRYSLFIDPLLSPLSYLVPPYATAPALMYVGLLMLG